MNHGIGDQEWNDYIDGIATVEVTNRIQSHCAVCQECSEFHELISCSSRLLEEASLTERRRFEMDRSQIDRMRANVLVAISSGGKSTADKSQVKGRLDMLEMVLAPYCGTRAAARALQSAAAQSTARTLEHVTADNWEPFLERLTAIAASMVGDTFANLVWERGRL
jgi:hypothetical protein